MDLKQILSLHLDGSSNREIGELLGISRNTANRYLRMFKASGLSPKELLGLDGGSLEGLFPLQTTVANPRYDELMHFWGGWTRTVAIRALPSSTIITSTNRKPPNLTATPSSWSITSANTGRGRAR